MHERRKSSELKEAPSERRTYTRNGNTSSAFAAHISPAISCEKNLRANTRNSKATCEQHMFDVIAGVDIRFYQLKIVFAVKSTLIISAALLIYFKVPYHLIAPVVS